MDEDGAWRAMDAQRSAIADLLEELSDDEWRRPSLCDGWTVRDVAAHLTLQQLTVRDALAELWAVGFHVSMNRVIHETARHRARLATDEIIGRIRATVGSRRHNAGVGYREALIDTLVHGQDIARAVDRDLEIPPAAAAMAGTRVWQRRWPFFAGSRLRGFRLVATDTEWSAGEGVEIHGAMTGLLLVSTGRAAGLTEMSGAGVEDLRTRLMGTPQ